MADNLEYPGLRRFNDSGRYRNWRSAVFQDRDRDRELIRRSESAEADRAALRAYLFRTLRIFRPRLPLVAREEEAIDRLTKTRGKLLDYSLRAVSQGKDALGEVTLKVDFGDKQLVTGKGASTDIIEASARAYLNAVNRFLLAGNGQKKRAEHP